MAGTMTVACKIPIGYILQVFEPEEVSVPIMGGGRKQITVYRAGSWSHTLHGPARKLGQDVPYPIQHGVALTHGVDADMFALWLDQHKHDDVVTKRLIFGQPKANDTVAQAHEHRSELSGAEPVDPGNLPPEFKRKIETATTTA
jgi:hypothetical protein